MVVTEMDPDDIGLISEPRLGLLAKRSGLAFAKDCQSDPHYLTEHMCGMNNDRGISCSRLDVISCSQRPEMNGVVDPSGLGLSRIQADSEEGLEKGIGSDVLEPNPMSGNDDHSEGQACSEIGGDEELDTGRPHADPGLGHQTANPEADAPLLKSTSGPETIFDRASPDILVLKQTKKSRYLSVVCGPEMGLFRPFTLSSQSLYTILRRSPKWLRVPSQRLNMLPQWILGKFSDFNLERLLERLRRFMGKIFFFEAFQTDSLRSLNPTETSILEMVLIKKQYQNLEKLKALLKSGGSNKTDLYEFWMMMSPKRKEQKVKYVFRYVIKYLEERFRQFELVRYEHLKHFTEREKQFLFYLYYFGQSDFGQDFTTSVTGFVQDTNFKKKVFGKMKKYSFPNLNNHSANSSSKTLNKAYFQRISGSQKFVRDIKIVLLSCLAHSGDFSMLCVENQYLRQFEISGPFPFKTILGYVVLNNNRELSKIFSHWGRLVKAQVKEKWDADAMIGREEESINRLIAETVRTNVWKKTFKLPWSLAEFRDAVADSFCWFIEHTSWQNRIFLFR